MSFNNDDNTKKLENLPTEFYQFIQMCNGIGIDFNNCNINIGEHSRKLNSFCKEFIADIIIDEKNSNDEKEFIFSYTKGIDTSALVEQIEYYKKTTAIGKEKFAKEFARRRDDIRRMDSTYYEKVISDYLARTKQERSRFAIDIAFTEKGYEEYDELVQCFQRLTDIHNEVVNNDYDSNFVAGMHTFDFDIVYYQNMIKGGIFIPTGGVILFEAAVNENKTIDIIKTGRYDSVLDSSYSDDNCNFAIDYRSTSMESLASKGIEPAQSEVIDFNSLLEENHLESLRQSPIGAIFKLKDVLLSKGLKNADSVKFVA